MESRERQRHKNRRWELQRKTAIADFGKKKSPPTFNFGES